MDRLMEKYRPAAKSVSKLDGIRLDFADGSWFGVRASNTEPLLRLNVEAKTRERMEELRDEISAFIKS
jgi:phosphomannomutase